MARSNTLSTLELKSSRSPELLARENDLIATIERNLWLYNAHASNEVGIKDVFWKHQAHDLLKKFVHDDLTVKKTILQNFRALNIPFFDIPTQSESCKKNPLPSRTTQFNKEQLQLIEIFEDLKDKRFKDISMSDLLANNPCNEIGNPNVFSYKGYVFTRRWLTRVWHLLLFKHFLEPRLRSSFCFLYLGSNYSPFSYLLKKEYTKCAQILVDFAEVLTLAHYYLGMSFPHAKIAGYKEVVAVKKIDRDFIQSFDFILLPTFLYNKLLPDVADVFCSISSLWEMSRQWFQHYMSSELFLRTPFFFCMSNQINPVTEKSGISIIDYQLKEFKKLHFSLEHELSLSKKRDSRFFEFIGQRM